MPDQSSTLFIRLPLMQDIARGTPFSIAGETWLYFGGKVRMFNGNIYNATLSLSSGSDTITPSSFTIGSDKAQSFLLSGITLTGDTGVKTPNLLAVVDVNGTNFTGSMPVVIRG
jgi:hypothetical protein